jgi:hypothetical protein
MMKVNYICPHCCAALNAKKNIILVAKNAADKNNQGLVFLHEEIGNYTVATSSTLLVETNDVVDFYCPVCHASLNSIKGDNLASFLRTDEVGEESTIVISRIYGERCTFQLSDRKQVKSYGESVQKYLDPEWFL